MRSIKQISPNPLLTSVTELRFTSTFKKEDVFGEFYKVFGAQYYKVGSKDLIPDELKKNNQELKYRADYTIQNDDYSISFSDKVIVFETVNEYKLWDNYFNELKNIIQKVKKIDKIDSLIRVGVRYASVFNTSKTINEVVNITLKLDYENYLEDNHFFRVNLKKGDIALHLQLIQNATVKKGGLEKKGLYIDIDAYQSNNLPTKIDEKSLEIINLLHTEEKKLFENLIKEPLLESYNVIYQ